METIEKITYSVKHFENSKDKDFMNALQIYNDYISVDTKTSTNQIIYFADHWKSQKGRTMYFLGLYINNEIVGYVEAGYLFNTKTIIIDYIVLKNEYHLNSAFYPLFGLIQKFFSDQMIDYDFIVTEVSTKCIEDIDSESFFSKKMLQLEDFRIANQIYKQSKLGVANEESNFEFQLLIRSKQALSVIKTETYLAIVKDIYYEHYYAWYSEVEPMHKAEYKAHIDEQFNYIKNSLQGVTEINFENSNPICEFYRASDCHYYSSTAGFINSTNSTKNRPILLFFIPIFILLACVSSIGIVSLLQKKHLNIPEFAPIFAPILVLCASIFVLAFTRIHK